MLFKWYAIIMQESIRNFAEQFNFEPTIENSDNLKPAKSFVVGGMGGSRLSAEILKAISENLDITIHKNYGLPLFANKNPEEILFIASSFSGNTEETIDFLEKALAQKLNTAVITKGGRLLEIALQKKLPFIKLPDSDIQPRMALGWSLMALLKLTSPNLLPELKELARILNPLNFEDQGEELAEKIKGKIPIIYASEKNIAIAEIWKIKFNETAKIPAFFNIFPELNHNEMTSFDYTPENRELSENFFFIFIKDGDDHPRIQKRMEITAKMLKDRKLSINEHQIQESRPVAIFNSLLLADWTALNIARLYNAEPEQVPMVEKFKKLLTNNN